MGSSRQLSHITSTRYSEGVNVECDIGGRRRGFVEIRPPTSGKGNMGVEGDIGIKSPNLHVVIPNVGNIMFEIRLL